MADQPSISDEAIVVQVLGGNIDMYEELMVRYEAKLQRYVTYLIHDPTAALDVVQETFIKAFQNLRNYNPDYKFSSWIYRIAHNEAMNSLKKNRYLAEADIELLPDQSYDSNTADLFDQKILGQTVRDCLGELEPKYREIIQLIYFEHMKYNEVSDILRIPTSTVGVWLSRAKAHLKRICEQKGVKQ